MLNQARFHILDIMEKVIDKPRPEISKYAPRLLMIKINPEKIGKLIGPADVRSGRFRPTHRRSGDIEDDGTVFISCTDADKAQRALRAVQKITEDIQVGRIYEGKVASVKDFGAFIEIQEGQDGLCHISELDEGYVSAEWVTSSRSAMSCGSRSSRWMIRDASNFPARRR